MRLHRLKPHIRSEQVKVVLPSGNATEQSGVRRLPIFTYNRARGQKICHDYLYCRISSLPTVSTTMPQEDSRTSKAIRRVVTGHDKSGKSIVEKDDERSIAYMPKHSVGFGVIWTTDKGPADNQDPRDGAEEPVYSGSSHNKNGGSVLRIVDFAPGSKSPLHRTQSIDYGIVLEGEIELELDSGEKRTLKAQDVCVQRGTDHIWYNRTEKWTRVAYILLDAQPILIQGSPLEERGFKDGNNPDEA